MKPKKGKLYLIPITLGSADFAAVIPQPVLEITRSLQWFVVENERTARRFFSKIKMQSPIDTIQLQTLNKHTTTEEFSTLLAPLLAGHDMGLMSEAGVPAVADPGAVLVHAAHQQSIQVVPLTGPNSILLALMASGFNGQEFSFNGYLPIDSKERTAKLRHMEQLARRDGITQIFMDTPFRNQKVLQQILDHCQSDTLLCIAADITLESEFIATRPVSYWKKQTPNLHKRPCMFLIGR